MLTLAGLQFPLADFQNSMTNQNLFFTCFLFLPGWICCSSQFPICRVKLYCKCKNCSGLEVIVQQVICDPLNVLLCSYMLNKGSEFRRGSCSVQSYVKLCGVMCLLPSTQAAPPPCPSHFRLSLPGALQRNGLGWRTPRRFIHSQIHDQGIQDKVCKNCHFFLQQ